MNWLPTVLGHCLIAGNVNLSPMKTIISTKLLQPPCVETLVEGKVCSLPTIGNSSETQTELWCCLLCCVEIIQLFMLTSDNVYSVSRT